MKGKYKNPNYLGNRIETVDKRSENFKENKGLIIDKEKYKDIFSKELVIKKKSDKIYSSEIVYDIFSKDLFRNCKNLEVPSNTLAFEKDKEIDYGCISYLTSNKKPDIYAGDQVIKANCYRINTDKEKCIDRKTTSADFKDEANLDLSKIVGEGEEVCINLVNEADNSEVMSDEDQIDKLKKQQPRYFHKTNITFKCYNCEEVGHMSKNCPYERIIICRKCNEKGHLEENCTNYKCFKCNKIGHKYYECTINSKDIQKCENCKNIGHLSEDCLIVNEERKNKILKGTHKNLFEKHICEWCNKKGHYVCPLIENPYIIEGYYSKSQSDGFYKYLNKNVNKREEKNENKTTAKKRRRILTELENKDIKDQIFCPKCSKMHRMKKCKNDVKYNNEFDVRRKKYSESIFNEFQSKSNSHKYFN
jgi:hypothetical protein